MANIRVIRRRIRSIQSTAKITKAMEMIATSKMKRCQERVIATRPYAERMTKLVAHLAALPQEGEALHPLLERRSVERITIVHITADRGLCGGLNSNVNRESAGFILEQGVMATIIAVGRRGRDFMLRTGQDVHAEFIEIGDRPTLLDTLPISRIVIDDYTGRLVDRVYLAYPRFVTTMVQRPVMEQLLPVEPEVAEGVGVEYIYEPSSRIVLAGLLPRFVEMQVYHAILEAIASEQSARMVAMRSATDNANDLVQDLTLMYNKARQEMITKELMDIIGGVVALE